VFIIASLTSFNDKIKKLTEGNGSSKEAKEYLAQNEKLLKLSNTRIEQLLPLTEYDSILKEFKK